MTTRRVKICNTPECRRVRALLSDFLDHSLHWRTARALQSHLAACSPCRCYVTTVEKTILLYRERPVVDVPVSVRGHLRELLRERHESAPKKSGGRCLSAAGGAKKVAPGVGAGAVVPGRAKKRAGKAVGKR